METWKILIITVAGAIVAGVAAGICIGKFLVKRAKSIRRRLLSTKERIVYSACILLGAALVLFGVFFKFPSTEAGPPDDMMIIDGGGMAADEKLRDNVDVAGDKADTADTVDETDAAQNDLPEGEVAEDGGIAVAAAA